MQNRIHLLSPDLINKIAAGEVIERPASILKELMENSIDAGALNIQVELEKSGLEKIVVSDDGSGMNQDEVKLAFTQHATSKIQTPEDLDRIMTLGFRGEALPSISSIASVITHSYNGLDEPVLLKKTSSEDNIYLGPGRNKGTTVTIQNIFSSMPVRRKFLRSENTEYKYFLECFINIAISKPSISFTLIKNNKTIFSLHKTQTINERVLQIFKTLSKEDLIEISFDNNRIKIIGLVGLPKLAKDINNYQYLFLNGRYIKNPLIHKAIKEGFSTAIMKNLEPAYFLFISIDPKDADVNVHPRKLEVRFNEPGYIYSTVKNLITKTIEKNAQNNLKTLINSSNKQDHVNSNIGKELLHIEKAEQKPLINEFKNIKSNSNRNIDFKSNYSKHSKDASINFTKDLLNDTKQISSELLSSSNNEKSRPLQIFNTYLIIEQEDKILIIDQHAAHERINFEKIVQQYDSKKNLTAQSLLIPVKINIDSITKEKLYSYRKFLFQIGFEFIITENTLSINQIPNLVPIQKISEIFLLIISELENTEGENSSNWTEIKNKILSTLACHSSIRAGQKLDTYIIEQIIRELFECKLPYSCPHGRPFFWEIKKEEIEKNFKR